MFHEPSVWYIFTLLNLLLSTNGTFPNGKRECAIHQLWIYGQSHASSCCSPCKGSNTTEWRKGKNESAPLLPLQENRYKGNNSYKRLLWQVNLYLFPSSKVSLVLSEQTSSHRRGGGPGWGRIAGKTATYSRKYHMYQMTGILCNKELNYKLWP